MSKPTWVKQSVWDLLDEGARKKSAEKGPETIGEWDVEIAALTASELNRMQSALSALKSWGAFNLAFKWTRIFVLIDSIQQELDRRERKK